MLKVNDAIQLSKFLEFEHVYDVTSKNTAASTYVGCVKLKDVIYDKLMKTLYDRFGYDTENTCVFSCRDNHFTCISPGNANERANFHKYMHLNDWNYCTCTGSSSINGTAEYVRQITKVLYDFSYLFAAIVLYISRGCSLTYTALRQLDEKDLFNEAFVYECEMYSEESFSCIFQEDEFENVQHTLYVILSYILYCAEYGEEPNSNVIDMSFRMGSSDKSVVTYTNECVQAIFDTFMNCSMAEYYRVLPIVISFIAYPYGLAEVNDSEEVTFWLFTNHKIPVYLSWRECHTEDTSLLKAMDLAIERIKNPIGQSEDLMSHDAILTPDFFQVWYVIGDNDLCRFNPCFRLARDIWDTLYTEWERTFLIPCAE